MKTISIFNNKGGVGKTTLGYNVACTLGEMGYKVLVVDLDPQCNFTIYSLDEDYIEKMWKEEEDYIVDFQRTRDSVGVEEFARIANESRSIHFVLKPVQDGSAGLDFLVPPIRIAENFDLIPGRPTMYGYENIISARWNGVLGGDPLSIRTVSVFRKLAEDYSREYGYDFVFFDTSPNLGAMNKVAISTADGFVVPCLPDLFSLYGVRNIGNAIAEWNKEFSVIDKLLEGRYADMLPKAQANLVGYLIYNAKKYTNRGVNRNDWDLAIGHMKHAEQIPLAIEEFIPGSALENIDLDLVDQPIGNTAVMHSHNTLAGMAQSYKLPMWNVPGCDLLEEDDGRTVSGNRDDYLVTKYKYQFFVMDMLARFGDEYLERVLDSAEDIFEECYEFINSSRKQGVFDLDPTGWLTSPVLKEKLEKYLE